MAGLPQRCLIKTVVRDFSAGRSEMLKKEIKVSDSKKQIEEIFAAEVLENVKKGWEKV